MNVENAPNVLQRMVARRDEGGFTLIELLIVIIILAVLAAIVVFAVGTTGQNAAAASCQADAKSVSTALEAFKAQSPYVYPNASPAGWTQIVPKYLRTAPGTTHYVVDFDNAGHVSVEKAGVTSGYNATYDIDTGSGGLAGVCTANAS
jgi:general secretion pathway protein G